MASNGKVRYSVASQNDVDFEATADSQEPPPDKSAPKSCMQRCSLYSCFIGFFFIFAGLVSVAIMKPIIKNVILDQMPLEEGSRVFQGWKNPPVEPVLFVRVFNLTNEREFLSGREKPKLVEVGPYAYRQSIQKTNVEFSSGDAVRYEVKRTYHFVPDMSVRSDTDDVVVVPNIPLFGAMKKLSNDNLGMAKSIFKTLLNGYDFAPDKAPFLKLTVREFLWGYSSILMSIAETEKHGCNMNFAKKAKEDQPDWDDFDYFDDSFNFDENTYTPHSSHREAAPVVENDPCDIRPGNLAKFGLFMLRNGTSLDPREINTGVSNLTERGYMISWHDQRRLNYWHDTPAGCNIISKSRDPGIMPIGLQKTHILPLFLGNMGRTVNFKYAHEIVIDEFTAYRFTPLENSFDNPRDYQDNKCYCIRERNVENSNYAKCLPSGLHDISKAQAGSPVILSWPHFLHGDPDLRHSVDGMQPDVKLHTFHFDIEPTYGITLSALAKLQMNVEVMRNSGFGYFDRINKERIIMPFLWIEEGMLGPPEIIKTSVSMMLKMPTALRNLAALIGLGVGLLLLVPEIFFWIRSCFQKPSGNHEKKEAI